MKKTVFTFLVTAFLAVNLFSQEPLMVKIDSIKSNACGGGNDACIYTSVSGGTAPYEFSWSKHEGGGEVYTDEDACGLTEGFYNFYVTDADQSFAEADTFIVDPVQMQPFLIRSVYGEYEISEYGAYDGFIEVGYVFGGTGNWKNFTYEWRYNPTDTQPFATGLKVTGLGAGYYYVTFHDSLGCDNWTEHPIELVEPDLVQVIDTVAVYDTSYVTVYDTMFITVYDTVEVIKFTEVAEISTFTDQVTGASYWVKNYGQHLLVSEPFHECKVYSITGSVVKQLSNSTEVPVDDLMEGIYLFYFNFGPGEHIERFYIQR